MTKLYAPRDHIAQGEHYLQHIDAMTGECLHAKSDIAAELAHRDIEIERLRAERVGLISALKDLANEFVKVFPVYYYAEPWAHERNVPLKVARAAIDAANSATSQPAPLPPREQK